MTRSVTSRSSPPHSLPVEIGMHSVAGKRAENEDRVAYFKSADEMIGLLADGMGGGAIGATMSDQAVRIAGEALRDASAVDSRTRLVHAFRLANQALLNLTGVSARYREGGSTLVAVLIQSKHGNTVAHIARLGDSRAYLRSATGGVRQIGRDHTHGEELRDRGDQDWAQTPGAHELTYALGADLDIEQVPDFYHRVPLQRGEMLLLCSDGLSSYVSHDELDRLLATGTAQQAAEQLVQCAHRNGSDDNISALVVRYDCSSPALPRRRLQLWLAVIGLLLLMSGTLAWGNLRAAKQHNPVLAPGFPLAASITSQSLSDSSSTSTSPELEPTSTRVPTAASVPGFAATTVVPVFQEDAPRDQAPTATVIKPRQPVVTVAPPRRVPTPTIIRSPTPAEPADAPQPPVPTESEPLPTPLPATPASLTSTPGAAATATANAGTAPPLPTPTPGVAPTATADAGTAPPLPTPTPGAAPTATANAAPPTATADAGTAPPLPTPGAAPTATADAGRRPHLQLSPLLRQVTSSRCLGARRRLSLGPMIRLLQSQRQHLYPNK